MNFIQRRLLLKYYVLLIIFGSLKKYQCILSKSFHVTCTFGPLPKPTWPGHFSASKYNTYIYLQKQALSIEPKNNCSYDLSPICWKLCRVQTKLQNFSIQHCCTKQWYLLLTQHNPISSTCLNYFFYFAFSALESYIIHYRPCLQHCPPVFIKWTFPFHLLKIIIYNKRYLCHLAWQPSHEFGMIKHDFKVQ